VSFDFVLIEESCGRAGAIATSAEGKNLLPPELVDALGNRIEEHVDRSGWIALPSLTLGSDVEDDVSIIQSHLFGSFDINSILVMAEHQWFPRLGLGTGHRYPGGYGTVTLCQSGGFPNMILDLSAVGTNAYAKQISTASLGDHSYIVVVGDEAVAIDIQRDLERFEDTLSGIDALLTAVLETHIHNDYVSGGKRLAAAHEATYVLPANTGAPYEHMPLADGDTVAVGGWLLRAMHTPGHTHNHTSYVLESPEGPVAIFSGGSMLVGAVGRSDLLGPDHTSVLLEGQYNSVHRIADELPDPSLVAPTHGAGSFCSSSEVSDTTSTIAMERLRNPALLAPSLDAFGSSQVLGYKQFPLYYRHMAPSNLDAMGAPPDVPLSEVSSRDAIGGAAIIDVRPFPEFAAGHLAGSLSFEMSNDDAVYMGWTMEWGAPVVLVGTKEDTEEVRLHLQRIGWDDVIGRIDPSSLDDFPGEALATIDFVTFADLGSALDGPLLDVRDPVEQADGVIPGADLAHLADVAADPGRFVQADDLIIYCAGGYRSGIAASFIKAVGGHTLVVRDNLTNYRGPLVVPAV
jgi:glyoxylase-like metal-dependent hydrolase (beta-lactamase superfamily II)/rhodanese-related sulfurtransferase